MVHTATVGESVNTPWWAKPSGVDVEQERLRTEPCARRRKLKESKLAKTCLSSLFQCPSPAWVPGRRKEVVVVVLCQMQQAGQTGWGQRIARQPTERGELLEQWGVRSRFSVLTCFDSFFFSISSYAFRSLIVSREQRNELTENGQWTSALLNHRLVIQWVLSVEVQHFM